MSSRLKYVKRATVPVAAVPLELETDGFTCVKWGSVQRSKAGDCVVNNGGDIYTVDRQTFERTYHQVGAGTSRRSPLCGRRWRGSQVASQRGKA